MAKKKLNERIPITFKNFTNTFKNLDLQIRLHIFSLFALSEDETLQGIDSFIARLKACEDQPGKQGAIEAYEHLKSGYLKMTEGERAFLRIRLKNPKSLSDFFNEKEMEILKGIKS